MCTCNIQAHVLCTRTYIHNLPNGRENVELNSSVWGKFLNEKIITQRRKISSSSGCNPFFSFILKVYTLK